MSEWVALKEFIEWYISIAQWCGLTIGKTLNSQKKRGKVSNLSEYFVKMSDECSVQTEWYHAGETSCKMIRD